MMIYHGDAMQYIAETPLVLRKMIQNRDVIFAEAIKCLDRRNIREIRLVGTGSSWNAAYAAEPFMRRRMQCPILTQYPSELTADLEILDQEVLVVGISQQGTSVSVIESLHRARTRGCCAIAVTGEYDTPITKECNAKIYVECGPEDAGATTKGYTATILTLQLFAAAYAAHCGLNVEGNLESYKATIDLMETQIQNEYNKVEELADRLENTQNLIILLDGSLSRILPEITLKFSETCRIPIRGLTGEEFIHGMYNAVSPETDFLILMGAGWERDKLERLRQYYQEKGNLVCIFNPALAVQVCNAWLYELPLLQQLCVLISRRKKIDLNVPRDPKFHRIIGSKLEGHQSITVCPK